ncbi:phage holin family protein, partial [bacterium]|nr:phage holin family protein [bacterium]
FKSFLFSIVALFGAAQLIEGFSFNNDLATLVMAAVVFGIVNSFLKPILKLVTLPFN